jgi:hypothetical protein
MVHILSALAIVVAILTLWLRHRNNTAQPQPPAGLDREQTEAAG